MKNLVRHIHALIATGFVLFFVWFLRFSAMNLENFKPVANAAQDFDYSDMLFRYRMAKPPTYSQIVIVDLPKYCPIDSPNRYDIAREMDTIFRYKPRVIGMDVMFDSRRDTTGNSYLLSVTGDSANTGRIVFSGYLNYGKNGDGEYKFDAYKSFAVLDSVSRWGYANFVGEKFKTVRNFKPFVKEPGQEEYKSFAAAIAEIADSDAYAALVKRNNRRDDIEYINYTKSHEQFIPHFTADSIFKGGDALSILTDKIILIANTDSTYVSDLQFTPMNPEIIGRSLPDMNGIFIHANILQMILDRNYINKVPLYLILIMVVIMNYLFIVFYFRFSHHHLEYSLLTRLAQIILFLVLMLAKVYLLKYFNLIFDDYYLGASLILAVDILNYYLLLVDFSRKGLKFIFSWIIAFAVSRL